MKPPLNHYSWINPPKDAIISEDNLTFMTMPKTDFWQRTYYGFQNENAHAFLFPTDVKEFTYQARIKYEAKKVYDQAGVIVFLDQNNWIKASIEYENGLISRLGSVVTNNGYSDWATTDIETHNEFNLLFRLSRRSRDFLIEHSFDGNEYFQMRICHLFQAENSIKVGVYGCSPSDSSIKVCVSELTFGECVWQPYQ